MDKQKKEITLAVASKIRHYRRQNNLSQEDLALRSNLNPAYLGQVERGLKCPTIDTLNRIATALDIPLSELVRLETSINTEEIPICFFDLLKNIPPDQVDQVYKILKEIINLL